MQRSVWRGASFVGLAFALIVPLGACAERPKRDRATKACQHLAELGRRDAVIARVKAEWAKEREGTHAKLDEATLNARVAKVLADGQAQWDKALAAKKGDLTTCAEGFVSLGTTTQVECILRADTAKRAKDCRKSH